MYVNTYIYIYMVPPRLSGTYLLEGFNTPIYIYIVHIVLVNAMGDWAKDSL